MNSLLGVDDELMAKHFSEIREELIKAKTRINAKCSSLSVGATMHKTLAKSKKGKDIED